MGRSCCPPLAMNPPHEEFASAFRLIVAVQELSLARSMQRVQEIVRRTARELTGADGATFVLREGGNCYYADEDAIGPLWKGRRFPLESCVSGWVMRRGEPLVIADIYADPRVPLDAYRPTFVKSLAMVPIRREAPIGAIGNYWASHRVASPTELQLLQALADSTSVALENVQVYAELEQRVKERTMELERANRELESFSYTVSHDLRAPIRHINGFATMLGKHPDCGQEALGLVTRIQKSSLRMNQLIDDMMKLARISRMALQREPVDFSTLAAEILAASRVGDPDRDVELAIAPGLVADGDPGLLRIALDNLLGNAWKFTARTPRARIEFGATSGSPREFFVRDNGPGFKMEHAKKLFQPFSRLHSEHEFPGSGIGLATVHRIVEKHGGAMRVEAGLDQGATFYFTLG